MDVVTAENHDFTVGDRVTVLAGATPASFTIVGIAEFANVGAPAKTVTLSPTVKS